MKKENLSLEVTFNENPQSISKGVHVSSCYQVLSSEKYLIVMSQLNQVETHLLGIAFVENPQSIYQGVHELPCY